MPAFPSSCHYQLIDSLLLAATTDWLTQGAAFWILATIWTVCAVFFAVIGLKVGKAVSRENDGCLLAIGNVVLALFGGGAGFLALMNHYPLFLVSALFGAMTFPALATWMFVRKARRS